MTELDLTELFNKPDTTPQANREFKPIPTDRYDVVVKDAQVDLTGSTPRVHLNYRIVQDGEFMNRVLFSSFLLTDTGAQLLKKSLRKLGVDATKLGTLAALSDALGGVIGKPCTVFAKVREYQKKDGTMGAAHNVYVNQSEFDLDNNQSSDEPLLKASDSSTAADDFNFD